MTRVGFSAADAESHDCRRDGKFGAANHSLITGEVRFEVR